MTNFCLYSPRPYLIKITFFFFAFNISDRGDSKMTVKRSLVCYADLLNHCCTSRLCGSIGSLFILKHCQFPEDCDLTKVNYDCEDSWPVKWVVIVPGTVVEVIREFKHRRF